VVAGSTIAGLNSAGTLSCSLEVSSAARDTIENSDN
jgi:hypothetical protein